MEKKDGELILTKKVVKPTLTGGLLMKRVLSHSREDKSRQNELLRIKSFNMHIRNWKLQEIAPDFEIVSRDSIAYIKSQMELLKLPVGKGGLYRQDTFIEWSLMPTCFSFSFDTEGDEERITKAFSESSLAQEEVIFMLIG